MDELISLFKDTAPLLASALGGPAAIGLGVLSWIAGKVTGDPNSSASSVASQLLNNVAKQKELELTYKLEVLKVGARQSDDQLQILRNEAGSNNIFIAGPHAAILWTGALSLFSNFVIAPYAIAMGYHIPILDLNQLMGIIAPMLGLSGIHYAFNNPSRKTT